jgi:hypothetical protein
MASGISHGLASHTLVTDKVAGLEPYIYGCVSRLSQPVILSIRRWLLEHSTAPTRVIRCLL